MKKNTIAVIGLLVVFCVLSVGLYFSFYPDDVFIHIGFAKDIAEGRGYSFAGNSTYGASSPLWPLLIALGNMAIGNYEITAKCLSLLFSIAALLLFYRFLKYRFEQWKSVFGTALLAFNPYMLR